MLNEDQSADLLNFLNAVGNGTVDALHDAVGGISGAVASVLPPGTVSGDAGEILAPVGKRKKRSSFYFEQFAQYKWDVTRPVPYAFDASICKFVGDCCLVKGVVVRGSEVRIR